MSNAKVRAIEEAGNPETIVVDFSRLKDISGLAKVEERVQLTLKSDAELLREIPVYLLEMGGKRIRPLLVFWSPSAWA